MLPLFRYQDGVKEYVKYVSYFMELACGAMTPGGADKIVFVFDISTFTLEMAMPLALRCLWNLADIVQRVYPERLGRCYLCGAPLIFWATWKIISGWLDERTAAKMCFVDSPTSPELQERISADVLEVDFGGTHPGYPEQAASLAEEIAAARALAAAPAPSKPDEGLDLD